MDRVNKNRDEDCAPIKVEIQLWAVHGSWSQIDSKVDITVYGVVHKMVLIRRTGSNGGDKLTLGRRASGELEMLVVDMVPK